MSRDGWKLLVLALTTREESIFECSLPRGFQE